MCTLPISSARCGSSVPHCSPGNLCKNPTPVSSWGGLKNFENSKANWKQLETLTSFTKCNDNKTTANTSLRTHCVQGSFHQEHERFKDSAGVQCVANSLTAIVMNQLKDICTWDSVDLDNVLVDGNKLYVTLRNAGKIPRYTNCLLVTDLPSTHMLHNREFVINFGQTFTGEVGLNDYDIDFADLSMSLYESLQRVLLTSNGCFLTLNVNTCAIIKHRNEWINTVLDSHSRNHDGLVSANRKSLIRFHETFDDMYHQHIINLARSLNAYGKPFQVTGVQATMRSFETNADLNVNSPQCEKSRIAAPQRNASVTNGQSQMKSDI